MNIDVAPLEVRIKNLEKELQTWRETQRDLNERVTGLEKKIYALEQLLAKE